MTRVARAYIDEAGDKGLLRKLSADRDGAIALVVSIVVPDDTFEDATDAFVRPFEEFKAARPPGAGQLHLTDAFATDESGIEKYPHWARVAEEVRSAIFNHLLRLRLPIIYDARRLGVARSTYEMNQRLISSAKSLQRSDVRVSDRASAERIDESVMTGLALKLDAYAEDNNIARVDLYTDQLDVPIAELFERTLDEIRTLSQPSVTHVKGWNTRSKEPVEGGVHVSFRDASGQSLIGFDAQFLGGLVVVGKDDAMVFASDVVANGLYYHFRQLDPRARLNHPDSVASWALRELVYGVREDAIEDDL